MTEPSRDSRPPPADAGNERVQRAIRDKAARMARARRQSTSVWRQLGQVGALGWLLVLPAVGFMALGRFAGARWEVPGLAFLGLAAGLLLGGFLVWWQVRQTLRDEPNAEARPSERRAGAKPSERHAEADESPPSSRGDAR